jgi:hypothetical protein
MHGGSAPYINIDRKQFGMSIGNLNYMVLHCDENPVYVFPEKELRGLSPNFQIHVAVSDLYNPRIGPHIFLQQNRPTNRGNI